MSAPLATVGLADAILRDRPPAETLPMIGGSPEETRAYFEVTQFLLRNRGVVNEP